MEASERIQQLEKKIQDIDLIIEKLVTQIGTLHVIIESFNNSLTAKRRKEIK